MKSYWVDVTLGLEVNARNVNEIYDIIDKWTDKLQWGDPSVMAVVDITNIVEKKV